MKICIELDEEMKERWLDAKNNLENTIKRYYNTQVSLTNSQILKGVLREWEPIGYLCIFDKEEIGSKKK